MTFRLKPLAATLAVAFGLCASPFLAATVQAAEQSERPVLYWYDPMKPQQHFDKPGKSPFMDMDLVPRYADEGGQAASLRIDARVVQNLGMRLARVRRETIGQSLSASGVLAFDERDVAIVQTRSAGFVERVYGHAPEDVLAEGAPLADLLIPEWAAAQEEYLALRGIGQPDLLAAARQRLRLAGMPAALIAELERTGKPRRVWTVVSPTAGVLRELEVREGMSLPAGASLARINGLDKVWLEVAIPEAQAAQLAPEQSVIARLPAFAGERIEGRIQAVLPQANLDSRTVRVRVELPNPQQRLRPGMSAEVTLEREAQAALLVPTEAVIRTGRRSLVMLAEGEGRYRPVAIRTGREFDDSTEVLEGLQAGQQVVASGQFLLDSEASLRGLSVGAAPAVTPAPELHEAEGTVVGIEDGMLGLAHGPFRSLNMPGMTMPFPVASEALLDGLKSGDRVRVAARQSDEGLIIERIEKLGGQP
ncbi:efflux RND transporter periplasmic adaptor subunit [Stutzerimonas balearica]|uniref:efflux RND transporter periplasmic adaptor subunit n=1 Tax=Stutzerimonas balearica TaxID=74829 RepID=UPI003F5C54C9